MHNVLVQCIRMFHQNICRNVHRKIHSKRNRKVTCFYDMCKRWLNDKIFSLVIHTVLWEHFKGKHLFWISKSSYKGHCRIWQYCQIQQQCRILQFPKLIVNLGQKLVIFSCFVIGTIKMLIMWSKGYIRLTNTGCYFLV